MPAIKSITQTTILNIRPSGQIQYIRDESLRGFGIKVTAKGKASFFVEKRVHGGRTVRKLIGDTDLISLREAKQEAQGLLLRLSKGEDVVRTAAIEAAPQGSLVKALEHYIAIKSANKLRASTAAQYKRQINHIFKDWLTMPVNAISSSMVADRYTRLLKQGKSSNYINSAFRTLKAVINSTGISPNPVKQATAIWNISLSSEPKSTFLRASEIRLLFKQYMLSHLFQPITHIDLYGFLFFILLTGCRKTEALDLTWADVSEADLTFRNTKNHLDHTIPNAGMIKDVVNARKHPNIEPTDRVFLLTEDRLKLRLRKAREEGNIGSWTTHDLRRTFAEHAQLAGFHPFQISMALNHVANDITRKSYLGGKLAKMSQLRNLYTTYQSQIMSYIYEGTDDQGVTKDYKGSRPDGIYDAQMIGTFPNYYELFHGALTNEILE